MKFHSSKKNSYPSHGRSLEIPRVRGGGEGLKVKILEAKHGAKVEFPWGEGCKTTKKPSMGGVWILSGTAHP